MIPNQFQATSSQMNVSFDYFDWISKTGYKNLYGLITTDSAGDKKYLTPNFISSHTSKRKITGVNVSAVSPTAVIDYDFDMTYNTTATIQGTMAAAFTYALSCSGASGDVSIYGIVNVYSVVSGAETLMGTAQTDTVTFSSATGASWRKLVFVDLTKTFLKIGDKLRINIQIFGFVTAPKIGSLTFYHDIMDDTAVSNDYETASDINPANIIFSVPFRIDI